MSQTEHQLSLTPFYAGWDIYQQRLVAAIAPLTTEQLTLRNSSQHWSVGMLAAHIVSARAWFFHVRLGAGSADLVPLTEWDLWDEREVPVRTTEELVNGLELTWQAIQSALASLTPADLGRVIPPYGADSPARTCQWIIWHILEHDIHHGGEISSILGAHGLAAVDLDYHPEAE